MISQTLREQVNRLIKQAEDEAQENTPSQFCNKCGLDVSHEHIEACNEADCPMKKSVVKEELHEAANQLGGGPPPKESQGAGGYGADGGGMYGGGGGMGVYSSANLTDVVGSMRKLASACRYANQNFFAIVDDRPVAEKLAELRAFEQTVQKIAEGDVPLDGNQIANNLEEYVTGEQKTPDTGHQTIPRNIPMEDGNKIQSTINHDLTSQEWVSDPLEGKKASAMFRVLRKHAQGEMPAGPPAGGPPGAEAGPPPGPPPGGPPGPPMPPATPPPPPGPNPVEVAHQLMAAGALTPESLAQAAGISPEEAAAVIASMTGGTGAPKPPISAPGPTTQMGVAPAAQPAPGGAAPATGMPVTAAADPAAIFQSALRKMAFEETDGDVKIGGGHYQDDLVNKPVSLPSNPGREYIASNESAIAMKHDQGNPGREAALREVLTTPPPKMREAGSGMATNIDAMTGAKTSSVRFFLQKRASGGRRPL